MAGLTNSKRPTTGVRGGRKQEGLGASSRLCGSTRAAEDSGPAHHERGGRGTSTGRPLAGFGKLRRGLGSPPEEERERRPLVGVPGNRWVAGLVRLDRETRSPGSIPGQALTLYQQEREETGGASRARRFAQLLSHGEREQEPPNSRGRGSVFQGSPRGAWASRLSA